MKNLILAIILSATAHGATADVICNAGNVQLVVSKSSHQEIFVTYKQETVLADGLLNNNEVDLIAKFTNFGEMTLVAKLGKVSNDNYLYFRGVRTQVICK